MIKPSLCCIHNGLKDRGVQFRTMTYAQYNKLGRKSAMITLADRALSNVKAIHTIIRECVKQNWNYRIGSNVFPLMTHPLVKYSLSDFYNHDQIMAEFAAAAKTIADTKIRCSMHPDQFVVPASPTDRVRNSAVVELEQHALIMDLLQLPKSHLSPINIHMNCFNNGNFTDAADRFFSAFDKLSSSVSSRLVLECEDKGKSWNTHILYEHLYKRLPVPITYDSHHHRVGNSFGGLSPKQACDLARSTWGNIKPLFHFSNGKSSPSDRAHSDFVYEQHPELSDHPTDVDFEFKMKESAILKFTHANE